MVHKNLRQPNGDGHGTDEQIELYSLNRLREPDLAFLEQHLIVCAACREKLEGISDFALGMREALETDWTPLPVAARRMDRYASGWKLGSFFRKPAFSMAVGFVALLVVIGILSNGRTKFAPSASLQLTAMRGEMPLTVPARAFALTLSDSPREGGPFRVEVLNAMGASVWAGLADSSPGGVHVNVTRRLAQGDYFVRLYSPAGKMLREYGFRVRA